MIPAIRVLAVSNAYPPHHLGGYEIIERGVVQHLRADGHSVRVLTTDHRSAAAGGVDDDPDVHRELRWYWRDHDWPHLGIRGRWNLERHNAAVFDRHLGAFAPDAVAWWAMGGLSLGLIERARRHGLPGVLFVLDYWLSYGRERDLWQRTFRALGPAADLVALAGAPPARVRFARAGRWVFCSAPVRDSALRTALHVGAADVRVLSPGVSAVFAPGQMQPQVWEGRLLYAGRVVPEKGVDTAVTALAQLPVATTLRIVGDGEPGYLARLRALADRLDVAGRLTFAPAVGHEDLAAEYAAADAVVFPVRWAEPWGLVPLEAMAVGRPVLATGRGGSGDYLVDGDNALLFDAQDAGALAAAARRLAGDDALRERLVAGGLATAAAHREDAFNRAAAAEIVGAARVSPA